MTDQLLQRIEELEQQLQTSYATKEFVKAYVDHMLGDLIPVHDPFTENSPIAGFEDLYIDRVIKHFQNIHGSYTLQDYKSILLSYEQACKKGNINPYLAVAQMVKETDFCRSWWSQRPRRNPAGLGVTGETLPHEPATKSEWAFDGKVWRRGYSFPSWDISAMAHIGHLLTYLYTEQELNRAQSLLVATDPRSKAVPKEWRGKIKTLKDLEGKYAIPGIGYGRSIATIANVLKQ